MAGKKKKLSRQERKKQKQQQKNRVRHHTGWEEPARPEINMQLLDDLRPFLDRPDVEKGLMALMALAAESDELVDEPEFISLFFPLGNAVFLFVETLERWGGQADGFFALPEETRSEKFFEAIEEILPKLLTDEFRETFLAHTELARTRFREAGDEQKLWQTSAVQFMVEMGEDDKEFFPGLMVAIAAKSVDAGLLLGASADEEETSEEVEATQRIDEFPGLRAYLDNLIQKARVKFVHDLIAGEIVLHLYTDAEIETVAELMEAQSEEVNDLDRIGECLNQILTESRRAEIGERLDELMTDLPESLEGVWPFLADLQEKLPDMEPYTAAWALLASALVGEFNAYELD